MDSGRRDEVAGSFPDVDNLHAHAARVASGAINTVAAHHQAPRIWWHQPDGTAMAAAGERTAIRIDGPGRFQEVQRWANAVADRLSFTGPEIARPRFFGGFAFAASAPSGSWAGFPAAWFVLPEYQVVSTDETSWVTHITEGEPATPTQGDLLTDGDSMETTAASSGPVPGLASQTPEPDRAAWMRQVRTVRDAIRDGRLRKAVLGHSVSAELTSRPDPGPLIDRLRDRHPGSFRFLIAPRDDRWFLGASPERLLEATGRRLRTDALAGSRRRGESTDIDESLAADLRTSAKETLEHDLVVEAIQRGLGECCSGVRTGERTVRRLDSVQHLHTPIRATRPAHQDLLTVAERLHPTPAVGGLPRGVALELIDQVETVDRGWYAGPIGWFDGQGDGQFAIGIRSALVGERTARLFAGAGIVAESDPGEEWAELQLKYEPIRSTFGDP